MIPRKPLRRCASGIPKSEVVYKILKTMAANKKDLVKSHGAFNGFHADKMYYKNTVVPYHPGAMKAYKEMGVM